MVSLMGLLGDFKGLLLGIDIVVLFIGNIEVLKPLERVTSLECFSSTCSEQ